MSKFVRFKQLTFNTDHLLFVTSSKTEDSGNKIFDITLHFINGDIKKYTYYNVGDNSSEYDQDIIKLGLLLGDVKIFSVREIS